jgi:hypothetical protein
MFNDGSSTWYCGRVSIASRKNEFGPESVVENSGNGVVSLKITQMSNAETDS